MITVFTFKVTRTELVKVGSVKEKLLNGKTTLSFVRFLSLSLSLSVVVVARDEETTKIC